MPAQRDWMDDDGARLLSRRVARYWADQGHGVAVRIEISATGQGGIGTLHCVRSDMLNGYPRSWEAGR